FQGLLDTIAQAFQEMETERFDAYIGQHLDFATGPTLALWGWVFGAGPQAGLTTEWYRRLIRLAIASKYGTRDVENMIRRWEIATEPSQVEFYRYPTKTVILCAFRDEWMPENYATRAAEIVRRGGPLCSMVLFEALDVY